MQPSTSPEAPVRKQRPLSPHLTIYKPQLTSGMSIFHKITGVGIGGGLTVFVIWLVCLALGPAPFAFVTGLCTSLIGKIFFIGWTWALFYHICCGVRHLLWAVGKCLTLPLVYGTGYVALAMSVLLTTGLWILLFGGYTWQ